VKFARYVAVAAGLFLVVLGFWAFFGPQSFFDRIATFNPYNKHLIHDIGAFQIGLGATLLIALARKSALATALAGVGIGSGFHAIAHWIDKDLGGRDSDPYGLTIVAVLILVAAAMAHKESRVSG
jgi:hypothetical protein